MGKKVFISYKYKDDNVYPLTLFAKTTVRTYVDKLEEYFEKTDNIYKGESDDEDLSFLSDKTIWLKLRDRIFDSSITIIMISPNMQEVHRYDKSQWIPWEISYSLKEMTRNDLTSHANAILAIILPDRNNSYEYFIINNQCNTCTCQTLLTDRLFKILSNNMFNQKTKTIFKCISGAKSNLYSGNHSYITSVKWKDFVSNPNLYINTAVYLKENINEYEIVKEI